MKIASKLLIFVLIAFNVILFIKILLHGSTIALLNPKGTIALQESNFIEIIGTCMLVVASLMVSSILFIAWKYRATNSKAKYDPTVSGSTLFKFSWWIIPAIAMCFLAIATWHGAHALDPYRPIDATTKPIVIQVVALQWKWLFIYPQQNIATVNFVTFPEKTPITFYLTADAPMNSFWIPQLGGQMYAMAGMQNQLHLIANESGEYGGSEVEINGSGFAGMRFTAKATSQAKFDTWVQSVKQHSHMLDQVTYTNLTKPGENTPITFYSPVEKNLYNEIMMKYMMPQPTVTNTQTNTKENTSMMQGMKM